MPEATDPSLADRGWWTLAALSLLGLAIQLSLSVTTFPAVTLVSALLGAAGLATLAITWTGRGDTKLPRALPWLILGLTVLAVVVVGIVQVYAAPAYGTDEIAFDQYAAMLALHGHNPYLHSMSPAFPMFHVSPNGYTFHLDGSPVTALSYPALSFLVYVPFLALGLHSQLAVIVNLASWLVATVLVFLFLPRRMAPLAIVIGGLAIYVTNAVGGVTDAMFVPLLVVAAFKWDRFAEGSWWRYASGPVALGLAMSVKQTPWLVLPLVLAALWRTAAAGHGWRRGSLVPARYTCLCLGTFLLPNVPYIVTSPSAWWSHITTPLASNVVPAGQGLVSLSLYLHVGGGDLRWYGALSIVLLVAFVVAILIGPASLMRLSFLLPSVVLFFASRSFGNYLTALVPAAIVAVVTASNSQASANRERLPSVRIRAGVLAGLGMACLACGIVALSVRSPLSVHVLGIRTTGQLATVDQITVAVTNSSDHDIRPAFTLDESGNLTTFWRIVHGPSSIAPGDSTSYTLESPSFFAQPSLNGGFQVLAFSSNPPAVSHTAAYNPSTLHVALQPDAIEHPVAVGDTVHVRAQLLDRLDRPVHRSGVRIYLGQIIYAQTGLQYATVRVNSGRPGETPVAGVTNAAGAATFDLKATQADSDPVYFEANLLSPTRHYPYGYSTILAIRFGSR
ncbi:MAG TPA: hypothetical protein VHV76_02835 [Mycobacteriales bacterium]|nr:hypothetical protein [Mycobacteriales bacterium]